MALALPMPGQIANWERVLHDLVSSDAQVSTAARKTSFDTLIPTLETENHTALTRDLTVIATLLENPDDRIRLQATALFAGLSQRRADSAEVIKNWIPALATEFHDSVPRNRQNAVRAVAVLRPEPPAEAVAVLLPLVEDPDALIVGLAVYAVAHRAPHSLNDLKAFRSLFAEAEPMETRRAAARVVGGVPEIWSACMDDLRMLLRENDAALLANALDTLSEIGPAGIAAKPETEQILSRPNLGSDLRDKAKNALIRLGN